MNDQDASLKHFTRMRSLAADLAQRHIAIYEHQVHLLAFGSFTVQVGTRHKRWRFVWDGKDDVMTVSFAAVSDSRDVLEWIEKETGQKSDAPYEFIGKYDYEAA